MYLSSLILFASKKSQKSGSTCPWEPIYWIWIMEFLVFNQKTDRWRGFEPFFHFDVKTKKLYFFSLIFFGLKIFQKSRSTCPSDPIYWSCVMEFLVFNQKTNCLRGFESFFHFDVKTKKLYFLMLIFLASKKLETVDLHVRESQFTEHE